MLSTSRYALGKGVRLMKSKTIGYSLKSMIMAEFQDFSPGC